MRRRERHSLLLAAFLVLCVAVPWVSAQVDVRRAPADATSLGLGTAATKSTGTAAGNVPILDGGGKIDASVLPAAGVTSATAGDGVSVSGATGSVVFSSWIGPGTARLVYTDPTTLTLQPGVIPLKVGSVWRMQVSASCQCSTGGLSPSTTYYVYFYNNAGTLTCEVSATGHATDATYGVEIKSGDATRTLGGMVRTNGSTNFSDFLTLSYFARRTKSNVTSLSTDRTLTSASYVEVNSEIRNTFLTWADEAVTVSANISARNDTGTAYAQTSLGFDGTTAEDVYALSLGGNIYMDAFALALNKTGLSEGLHYVTLLGLALSGTGTARWAVVANTAGNRPTIWVGVRG